MHTGLGAHPAVRVFAAHVDRSAFDARDLARGRLDDLGLVTMRLRPTQVHAQDHLRPILCFGSTSAGLNVKISVVGVHLTRKHTAELESRNARLKRGDIALDFGDCVLVVFLDRHLQQFVGLTEAVLYFVQPDNDLLQPRTLLPQRLRTLGFVPDVGLFEFALNFGQSFRFVVVVKDTSSTHRCVR